jgi:hypothetical protein
MSKNTSQPPYTPEQARARARAGPKTSGTHKAGSSAHSYAGNSKAGRKGFKPGKRTGAGGRN